MRKMALIITITVLLTLPASAFGVKRGIVGEYEGENREKITFYSGGRVAGWGEYVLYRQISDNSVYMYKKSGEKARFGFIISFDRKRISLCKSPS